MNDSLKLSVQKITKLPTLPAVAREVLDLASDDLLAIDRLETLIENDPPIASKILSVSNSAFFGVGEPSTSIASAIVRIGFNNVKDIAISTALLSFLGNKNHNCPIEPKRIFEHSVAVGIIAKLLSCKFGLFEPEEMFVCGLLHDIGIFVLNSYFSEDYRTVIAKLDNGTTLSEAENEVLGFTHPTIGIWLADKWKLPAFICSSIQFHHEPSSARDGHVSLIHLADCIACRNQYRSTEKVTHTVPDDSIFDTLNISRADLFTIEGSVKSQIFAEGILAHE